MVSQFAGTALAGERYPQALLQPSIKSRTVEGR
jgi:hypothetical protein